MPKRKVTGAYYTTLDGQIHPQGEVVDLPAAEAERGDSLGVLAEVEKSQSSGRSRRPKDDDKDDAPAGE